MKINERQSAALIKRAADFLEKMSVASFAVGVFQSQVIGIWLGLGCLASSAFITYLLERK